MLDMNFKGSVYHPKFFDFDLLLGVSPRQLKEENNNLPGKKKLRKDNLFRYNLNGRVLKEKPVNFDFFLNKENEVENRDFFERQTSDTFSYGQRLNLKESHVPMNAGFHHTENDTRRSFRPNLFFEENVFNYEAKPVVPLLKDVDIAYARESFTRTEEGVSQQKGKTDHVSAANLYPFGPHKEHDLSSFINYYNLKDSSISKDFSAAEVLSLKHTDDLKSVAQYNYYNRSTGEVVSKQNFLSMGLRHQLFESLSSSFDLKGSALSSTSFDETKTGFDWKEEYKKHIGVSVLHLGLDYDYEHQDRGSVAAFLNVVDETHVLDDASVVLLNEVNADAATIVVKNGNGSVTFTKDSDYIVIQHLNGKIEIKRSGGNIANGEQIRVDYVVQRNPSFQFNQMQNGYETGLDVFDEKFKIYRQFRQRNFSNIKGGQNTVLEEFDDTVSGSEINFNWAHFKAEYEEYESDLSPYDTLRFYQDFQLRLVPTTELLLSARHDHTVFPNDSRDLTDLRSSLIHYFSTSVSYRLEAGQIWQKGSGINEERFTLRNVFRKQLSMALMELGYEYERKQFLGQDYTSHYLYTNFKRKF